MTPHAVSRQAQSLLDGVVPVHRILPVPGRAVAVEVIQREHPAVLGSGYGPEQYKAALDRRRADLANLADVADELTAIDRAAAELDGRVTQLLALATDQGRR